MAKDSANTITYEMLGVDMLVVDEFHSFKNLYFKTRINRIAGLPNSESQRAFDMYMKDPLVYRARRQGGRPDRHAGLEHPGRSLHHAALHARAHTG
jgi:N12 class adenine-specific DNA methylase